MLGEISNSIGPRPLSVLRERPKTSANQLQPPQLPIAPDRRWRTLSRNGPFLPSTKLVVVERYHFAGPAQRHKSWFAPALRFCSAYSTVIHSIVESLTRFYLLVLSPTLPKCSKCFGVTSHQFQLRETTPYQSQACEMTAYRQLPFLKPKDHLGWYEYTIVNSLFLEVTVKG